MVFIHLVDYDLVDGQLAYAAGGPDKQATSMDGEQPLITQPKHCRYASTKLSRQIQETYRDRTRKP